MKGELIPFGQIEPNRLIEKALIGIESESKGKFELHEIVTKVATEAGHADMLICRSFTEPDKIKTISFWTDIDRQLFVPEKQSSILDFISISPVSLEGCSEEIGEADISRANFRGAKNLVFYAEKVMRSGKIKFAMIQSAGKAYDITEIMSGATPRFSSVRKLYSKYDVERNIKRLKKLGYQEKKLPANEA